MTMNSSAPASSTGILVESPFNAAAAVTAASMAQRWGGGTFYGNVGGTSSSANSSPKVHPKMEMGNNGVNGPFPPHLN
jgi:hypothetical protein